jgi:hypothetical protein
MQHSQLPWLLLLILLSVYFVHVSSSIERQAHFFIHGDFEEPVQQTVLLFDESFLKTIDMVKNLTIKSVVPESGRSQFQIAFDQANRLVYLSLNIQNFSSQPLSTLESGVDLVYLLEIQLDYSRLYNYKVIKVYANVHWIQTGNSKKEAITEIFYKKQQQQQSKSTQLSIEYIYKLSNDSEWGILKEDAPVNSVLAVVRLTKSIINNSTFYPDLNIAGVYLSANESRYDRRNRIWTPAPSLYESFAIKKFLRNFYMLRLIGPIDRKWFSNDISESAFLLGLDVQSSSSEGEMSVVRLVFQLLSVTDMNIKLNLNDCAHECSIPITALDNNLYEYTVSISEDYGTFATKETSNEYLFRIGCSLSTRPFLDGFELTTIDYERIHLEYSLTSNSRYSELFEVHKKTGQMTLKSRLDREKLAMNDQSSPVIIQLNVTVHDTRKLFKSAILQMFINVLDLNDNMPAYSKDAYFVNILYNWLGGYQIMHENIKSSQSQRHLVRNENELLVFSESALDLDYGRNATLIYYLLSVENNKQTISKHKNCMVSRSHFRLNSTDGKLWMSSRLLRIDSALDIDDENFNLPCLYSIKIACRDDGTPHFKYTIITINIELKSTLSLELESHLTDETIKKRTLFYEVDLDRMKQLGSYKIAHVSLFNSHFLSTTNTSLISSSRIQDSRFSRNMIALDECIDLLIYANGELVVHWSDKIDIENCIERVYGISNRTNNYFYRRFELQHPKRSVLISLFIYLKIKYSADPIKFTRSSYEFVMSEENEIDLLESLSSRRLVGLLNSNCATERPIRIELINSMSASAIFTVERVSDASGDLRLYANTSNLDYEHQSSYLFDLIAICELDEPKWSSHLIKTRIRVELTDINDNVPVFIHPFTHNQTIFKHLRLRKPVNILTNTIQLSQLKAIDEDISIKHSSISYKLIKVENLQINTSDACLNVRFRLNESSGLLEAILDNVNANCNSIYVEEFYVLISAFNNLNSLDNQNKQSISFRIRLEIVLMSELIKHSMPDLVVMPHLFSNKSSTEAFVIEMPLDGWLLIRACWSSTGIQLDKTNLKFYISNRYGRIYVYELDEKWLLGTRKSLSTDNSNKQSILEIECKLIEDETHQDQMSSEAPSYEYEKQLVSALQLAIFWRSLSVYMRLDDFHHEQYHSKLSNVNLEKHIYIGRNLLLLHIASNISMHIAQVDKLIDLGIDARLTMPIVLYELAKERNFEVVNSIFRVHQHSGLIDILAGQTRSSKWDQLNATLNAVNQLRIDLNVYFIDIVDSNKNTMNVNLNAKVFDKYEYAVYLHFTDHMETSLRPIGLNERLVKLLNTFLNKGLFTAKLSYSNKTNNDVLIVDLIDQMRWNRAYGHVYFQISNVMQTDLTNVSSTWAPLFDSSMFFLNLTTSQLSYIKNDVALEIEHSLFMLDLQACITSGLAEFCSHFSIYVKINIIHISTELMFNTTYHELMYAPSGDQLTSADGHIKRINSYEPFLDLKSFIYNKKVLKLDRLPESDHFSFEMTPDSQFYLEKSSGLVFISDIQTFNTSAIYTLRFAIQGHKLDSQQKLTVLMKPCMCSVQSPSQTYLTKLVKLDSQTLPNLFINVDLLASNNDINLELVCVNVEQVTCSRLFTLSDAVAGSVLLGIQTKLITNIMGASYQASFLIIIKRRFQQHQQNYSHSDVLKLNITAQIEANNFVNLDTQLATEPCIIDPTTSLVRIVNANSNIYTFRTCQVECDQLKVLRVRNLLSNSEALAVDYKLESVTNRRSLCWLSLKDSATLDANQLYSFDIIFNGDNQHLQGKINSLYVARLGKIDSCFTVKRLLTIDAKLIKPNSELFDLSRLETDSTNNEENNGLLVQSMFIISAVKLNNMNSAAIACPNPRAMFVLDDERLKLTGKLSRNYLLRCLANALTEINIYAFIVDKISLRIIKAIEFNLSLETLYSNNLNTLNVEYFKSIEITTSDLMRNFLSQNSKNSSNKSDGYVPIYRLNATEYVSACSLKFPVRYSLDESTEWGRTFKIDRYNGQLYYFLAELNSSFAIYRLYGMNVFIRNECENRTSALRFEWRLLNDEPVIKLQNLRNAFVISRRPKMSYELVGQLDVVNYLVGEMRLPKSELNLTFELIDDLKESTMFRLNKRTAHLFISDANENNEKRLYSLRVLVNGNCARKPIMLILNVFVYQYEISQPNKYRLAHTSEGISIQFEKSIYEFMIPLYSTNNSFFQTRISTFQTRAFIVQDSLNGTNISRSNLYFRSLGLESFCSVNSFNGLIHCDMERMKIGMCSKGESEYTMTLLTYAYLQSKYILDIAQVIIKTFLSFFFTKIKKFYSKLLLFLFYFLVQIKIVR